MEVKEAIEAFIQMTPHDRSRLYQCITCQHEPSACGKTDKDEDENGFCKFYLGGLKYKEKKEKKNAGLNEEQEDT